MKRVYAILVTILLIAGCVGNRQVNEGDGFITVDVTKRYPQKELILQDFMDVEYIPLETGGEFYCQGIVLDVGREYIVARNQVRDGDIFIFDRNGKGVRKINRMGQGGEEYNIISGITLDEKNSEIFVNDQLTDKILVYDLFGNFKRSFMHKENYRKIYNYDNDKLICRDGGFNYENSTNNIPFFIISKLDGSIIEEIQIPFTERISTWLIQQQQGRVSMLNINSFFYSIIPFHNNWIITEPSSDTVYRFLPDYSIIPFIVRTPSIQTMDPEVFLFPGILSERYHFMQIIKKEQEVGFATIELMHDKSENTIFEYIVYNDDFANKKTQVNMMRETLNDEIAFWQKIEADELVESYGKGELNGKLKENAEGLEEEANPVIMLVKYKK